MLDNLSPARRRFVLVLASAALAVVLVVALIVIRQQTSGGVDPVAQDKPGPVLLVPGYGGSLTSLGVLARALEADGRDVSLVDLPGDGTGALDDQAKALDAAARGALESLGGQSVDVVGYSAGGVVARLWVRSYDGGNLARRVVTLGSPQHGTGSAGLAVDLTQETCPAACVDLAPDSDLLRRLNAGDETPLGPAFVSIWSSTDQVVTPPDSARLEGATNVVLQDVCATGDVSHGDLPAAAAVIALVEFELASTPAAEPTRADCSPAR